MMSLTDETEQALGADYRFHQKMTAEEIKRVLKNGDMSGNDNVPIVLEAGNLDIEMVINFGEYLNGDRIKPASLEYFCCVRIDGTWESYNDIFDEVNLDVPDIESEMLRVLEKYTKEEGLSFTGQNQRYSDKQYSSMEMR